VLLIASTGRCATLALCEAVTRFGDAQLEHEPAPRLLREAWLRHLGLPHETPLLAQRLAFFRDAGPAYGQTMRAAPLLPDFAQALPAARFVLLFRDPLGYLESAASRGVLARGDEWDLYRVMPLDVDLCDHNRAERIALHWDAVNRHLLAFARREPQRCLGVVVRDLASQLAAIVDFAGWHIRDRQGLDELLAARPNKGGTGFAAEAASTLGPGVRERVQRTWEEIVAAFAS